MHHTTDNTTLKTIVMNASILGSATLQKGYGTLSALEKELSPEDIRHLQLGGYIENGISPKVGETFRLTKRGKDMLYFNSDKISLKHRIQNFFGKRIFVRLKNC